jgi:cyclopropane-fatty-acyl-phospholipid synthase
MNSRIYSGKVMHARHVPVTHQWIFPFYFYAIDLDELPELDRTVRGFRYNAWAPVSLRDSDYLRGSGGFRERLSAFIDTSALDRIVLVTVARFMTRVFNPVSFYYGLRADGSPACMAAEVNNTFGERHLYVLDGGTGFPLQGRHDKAFHVSPFNDMNGRYEFTFSAPDDDLSIGIKLIRQGETVMDAAMWGQGRPLTGANLWKTVLTHPLTAGLTMPRILWQAARLHYRHRLPVFRKPAPSSPMTIKANP